MQELVRQFLRFGAVGAINTAIGLFVIYLVLFFFNADPAVANAIGYAIGLPVSFSLNRIWTFREKSHATKSAFRFVLVVVVAYLCNIGSIVIGTHQFGANSYLIQLPGIAIYTTIVFIGCRYFVFGKFLNSKKSTK